MSTPHDVAVAYVRQSHGKAASIDQQGKAAEKAAAANGWDLSAVYSDGSSASAYATKGRKDWARVLTGIKKREFDILILWESSRGDRRLSSWSELLDDARDAGICIYVVADERLYDMANDSDWKVLATAGVDSEHEVRKTSKRVGRAHGANAQAGKPTGRTPLGYVRIYDPTKQPGDPDRLIAQLPDDHPTAIAEAARIAALTGTKPPRPAAPMIREMFARLAAGQAMRSIARDFAEAGWRTRKGTPFTMAHLRTLAAMHAYAGLRSHCPGNNNKVTASGLKNLPAGRVNVYEGTWEGLVTREQFEQVQAMYRDRAREKSRPSRAVHLLTVIAVCDVCGGPMTTKRMPGKQPAEERPMAYSCRMKTCVAVNEADLDAHVSEIIVGFLEREDIAAVIARQSGEQAEDLQALRDDIAALQARLDELAENLELSESVLGKRSAAIEKQIDVLRKRERAAITPAGLAGMIELGAGVRQRWEDAPLEVKRAVAGLVLVPELLGRPRIVRRATGAPVPVKDRVRFE